MCLFSDFEYGGRLRQQILYVNFCLIFKILLALSKLLNVSDFVVCSMAAAKSQ